MKASRRVLISAVSFLILGFSFARADIYQPPTTYYNSATGTGSTLMTQLRAIISSMTGVNYGNARFSAPITDRDPNNFSNILLIYNRASVSPTWDGGSTWNREHIWPVSRLGVGDPGNTTTNISSDQFNLRPANPSINSSRSNKPFGMDATTGANQHVGSYYYPGDADAGDVARAQFYMATRYSQLSLTDGTPSGTQMGDLSSLVNYHFRDVPDEFERRRNHAIYGFAGENSPTINNPYRQSNRNPYVDHPEYVWSVFVDQQNDSRLYVGNSPAADGSSSLDLNLGTVFVNAAVPSPQSVMLNKVGLDGTYYEITSSGAATSSVTGRMNAFPVITSGSSSRTLSVGLDTNTATAGLKSGTVTIDNLDVTTAGGAGRGANDGNDQINVSLTVFDHANPSFMVDSDINSLILDFGTVAQGSPLPTLDFEIANLLATASFTSDLEFDGGTSSGDAAAFSTGIGISEPSLEAGTSRQFTASMSTDVVGSFSAIHWLTFSDIDLPGANQFMQLSLTLMGTVEEDQLRGDFDGDGDVDGRDFLVWQRNPSVGNLTDWQAAYGQPPISAIASTVPEPSTALMAAMIAGLFLLSDRRSVGCYGMLGVCKRPNK